LRSDTGATLQAIAFRSVGTPLGDFLERNRGARVHVAGQLQANYWNGARSVQFRIVDAALSPL
jgi:single-stranded-DNA-specific exonuclease